MSGEGEEELDFTISSDYHDDANAIRYTDGYNEYTNPVNAYFISFIYRNSTDTDTDDDETENKIYKIKVHSFIYDDKTHDIEDNSCSICTEKYKTDDEVAILKCEHLFHKNCLMEWTTRNPICPLCRSEIPCEEE